MNEARVVVRTVDENTYTSPWHTKMYENKDSIINLLQNFNSLKYLSLPMDDDEILYFNPANIIYAKVETR